MTLDPHNPIPLHVQLKEVIRTQIDKGIYIEKIPSERELMERFLVSRSTVREAVSALVREGVLEKIHGKGTFINSHTVNEWLGNISGLTETIDKMGMKPGSKLLSHGRGNDKSIARTLGVKQYYAIERLRFANDDAIAIERTYYREKVGLELAKQNLNEVSLYPILESIGVIFAEAEQKIVADMPSRNDAKLLEILPTQAVLVAKRVSHDARGKVVEFYNGIFRSDKYAFCIKLSKKPTMFYAGK